MDELGANAVIIKTLNLSILCPTEDVITDIEYDFAASVDTIDFNLLEFEPSQYTIVPVTTFSIFNCNTITYKLHRSSDDQDMKTLFPELFDFVELELFISGEMVTFEYRNELYNSGSEYYVEGTFTDSESSKTAQHPITINWIDACRTATIIENIISYDPVMWSSTSTPTATLSIPAHTDSVGGIDDLEVGICGEKKITLDEGTPSYLTLVDGTDPVLDPFSIDYD